MLLYLTVYNFLGLEQRYDRRLQNFWCTEKFPTIFCGIKTKESRLDKSICNIAEADELCKIVVELVGRGVEANEIGIITSYTGQIKCVRQKLMQLSAIRNNIVYSEITVASVNGFQVKKKIKFTITKQNILGS